MPKPPRVYLIDASVYVFRAWFSLPDSIVTPDGQPVNAAYGYTRFLCNLLTSEQPAYIAAAFDESLTSCLRNDWYPEYKANREAAPEDLKQQFSWCKQITRALGVRALASPRYEADDLIATLAHGAHEEGMRVTIVSRDKDLAQLLKPGDHLWDGLDGERLTPAGVKAKFGVTPAQIADLLALAGDAVDNIPGVPGIGLKTAARLLAGYGSLESLYCQLATLERSGIRGWARIKKLLQEHETQARLSQRLASLHHNNRIKRDSESMYWLGARPRALNRRFEELGFGKRITSRCLTL
jgi:5'-3' exonuclease